MKALRPLCLIVMLLLTVAASAQVSNNQKQQENAAASNPELVEASRLNKSVISLFNQQKYDQALPLAKRVLEIREKTGADDELIIGALINLAEVQVARSKFGEAQPLFERVLRILERTGASQGLKGAQVYDRLAFVNYANGNLEKTESYYKQALAIRERTTGPEQEDLAQSLNSLAEFYQVQGQYKKAEPVYQRLIEIRTKNSAKQPAFLGDALERYACLLHKEHRRDEATLLEARAYSVTHAGSNDFSAITGGVVNGKATNLSQPPYPEEARRAGASGKVTVRVQIDEAGAVIRACAVEGPSLLLRASESAAYRSKFSPTFLEGKPVKVNGTIMYQFIFQ